MEFVNALPSLFALVTDQLLVHSKRQVSLFFDASIPMNTLSRMFDVYGKIIGQCNFVCDYVRSIKLTKRTRSNFISLAKKIASFVLFLQEQRENFDAPSTTESKAEMVCLFSSHLIT